ncbi:UBX domain containing protein [Naviculisporaceae sp. PSN 640]
MADTNSDFDVGQLTPSQQEALQQYTDVTGQDIKDAVPLLERSQWNVQIAISKFFDGEGPDPVAEAQAALDAAPRAAARHENLHESFLADAIQPPRRSTRSPRTDLAPRVVPQTPVVYQPPLLLSILFAPFRFGYGLFGGILRSVLYLLSFLPSPLRPRAVASSLRAGWKNSNGRRSLLPKETAERFKREFEEEYGANTLPFFEGGHAQALDTAKKDLKFLLTVLISPEHDDTDKFVRNTLLAPQVVSFINDSSNNIMIWGGNVLDSEPYQVAREYMCTKYPFSCLICLTPKEGSTRMGVIKRIAGPVSPDAYVSYIQKAMEKYAPELDGVRAERAAQAMARNLRSEQDSAYERSLARDRERARQRKEAAAAAAAAEQRAREEAEAAERLAELREQWRKWRATTIAPEPDTSVKDSVRLALNMPVSLGGDRVIRRFARETSLEDLYAFVECYELLKEGASTEQVAKPDEYEHKYSFQISSLMPRETFAPDTTITIAEKIGRGGSLIVEDISPEDDGYQEA